MSAKNEREWAELCTALWPHDTVESWIQRRDAGDAPHEYLYVDGEEAVAFLSLSLRHDYVEGTDSSPVGYVEGIYVKPCCRGKGIAKELIAHAKKWALERGCIELASDCALSNEDSRAFHKGAGFQEANVIVCFTMKL